jgi:DNA (cytosine-5)-methyltransferase 1
MTGVDVDRQPRYCGDAFYKADAVGFVMAHLAWIKREFVFIHASPPCQFVSATQRIQRNAHPNLIPGVRAALELTGLPYVIENVVEARAHLVDPVTLCGGMFGLHTYRDRLFESGGGFTLQQPLHPEHVERTVKMGRPLGEGDFYHAVGNFSNVPYVRKDMGMPWASREGIREAIPPVYAQWIGEQFLSQLERAA